MSKHTPGPWFVGKNEDDNFEITANDGQLGVFGKTWIVAEPSILKEQDARLIAAAPELLDLVKVLVSITINSVDPKDFTKIREQAWAAIDKAEGRDE